MIRNFGKGTAENFRITSGQPVIVDNEKGLVVNFKLIGTTVNGFSVSPALGVNFGMIQAGTAVVAQFLMISSLQGIIYYQSVVCSIFSVIIHPFVSHLFFV